MAFHKAKALQAAEKSVAQGKIAHSIKQYQEILDEDPSDLSLLNTIGDLYIREKNIAEGLRQFHKLAEAYVREGFNVKAIAIYRKIFKIDPVSAEPVLKLAELYRLQGLGREAREQYLQAAEAFKKGNKGDRALETLRKLVQYDPENTSFRDRLAAECEQQGMWKDAAHVYWESAELLIRRGDQAGAEPCLKKAAELDPKNLKIQMLRARVAAACGHPEEAASILNTSAELLADPAAKRILLDAYIGLRRLAESKALAREVFEANPAEVAPISAAAALLAQNGAIDDAYQLIESVTEPLLRQDRAGELVQALRPIWDHAPNHLPTLGLICRLCEKAGDESTLAEVLEALARAHLEAGDLEKAEQDYLHLIELEADNQYYRGCLNAVQRKLGKATKPVEFSPLSMALEETAEHASDLGAADLGQASGLQEALDNSELFERYNLPEKAIAELEKVLKLCPDQIEVHRRILEISWKRFPSRGAAAAAELARIFASRGDAETANRYQAMASAGAPLQEPPPASAPAVESAEELPSPPPAALEMSWAPELSGSPSSPVPAKETGPVRAETATPRFPFDLTPPGVQSGPLSAPQQVLQVAEPPSELDLTAEFEAFTAEVPAAPVPDVSGGPSAESVPPGELPASMADSSSLPKVENATAMALAPSQATDSPLPALPHDLEESRIELEFYLENGFLKEARQVLAEVDRRYPGIPLVAELYGKFDLLAAKSSSKESTPDIAKNPLVSDAVPKEDPTNSTETPLEASPTPLDSASSAKPDLEAEDLHSVEWERRGRGGTSPAVAPREAAASSREAAWASADAAPRAEDEEEVDKALGLLGKPAEAGALSPYGFAAHDSPPSPAFASLPAPAAPLAEPLRGIEQLSSLLAELEGAGASSAGNDPETHYNLGVAYREMGLLDEAIGEFQKVVKGARTGTFPLNFLQACSLLGLCFMQKQMPAIAARWYLRALEAPGLDEEAQLVLEYDLGVAYEQAGDLRKALERYTEVYSLNIDFRDVADKVRDLQHHAR